MTPAASGTRLPVVGLALAAAGFAGVLTAQRAMGKSWRVGVDERERTALDTGGRFRRVRNPIFTAMVAAQLGTAMMAPTWLSALGVACLAAAVQLQVRAVEEPYLPGRTGTPTQATPADAGRFLPGVGRLRPGRSEDAAGASPARASLR